MWQITPKLRGFKQQTFIISQSFWGSEIWKQLNWEVLAYNLSPSGSLNCWPELQSSEGSTGAQGFASKFTPCGISIGRLTLWQLTFSQSKWSKKDTDNLSTGWHTNFCSTLLVTRTTPGTVWEGTIQGVNARRGGNWGGPSWILTIPSQLPRFVQWNDWLTFLGNSGK